MLVRCGIQAGSRVEASFALSIRWHDWSMGEAKVTGRALGLLGHRPWNLFHLTGWSHSIISESSIQGNEMCGKGAVAVV